MRRAAVALLVALAILPTAGRAAGGAACRVLADPRGDVAAAGAAETPAQPAWLDLAGVRLVSHPEQLLATIDVPRLRDLDPATPGRAVFELTWREGAETRFAGAAAEAGRWTFGHGHITADGDRISRRGGGSVDGRGVTVRAPVRPGALLADVRVTAAQVAEGHTASFTDRAPNLGGRGPSIRAGEVCAGALDDTGARCHVASDAADDARPTHIPATTPSEDHGRATEIIGIALGTNETTVIAEIHLASAEPAPDGSGERWEVTWENPWFDEQRTRQAAFAERRAGRLEFGYDAGSGWVTTQGALVTHRPIVRILVPRAALRLPDGTRMLAVAASAAATRGGTPASRDRAPDDDGASWVVGPGCENTEVQVCPVTLDGRGDGRLIDETGDAPRNEGWLDIRAAGAAPASGALLITVRVQDLAAESPAGAERVGWTVSWDHAGRRWFAQAERAATGTTFRSGARAAGAGPAFGGIRAQGRIDAARDLITIVVPRGSVGAPSDGAALDRFVATAWASYGTGDTTASLQVVDRTPARRYLAGTDCGA